MKRIKLSIYYLQELNYRITYVIVGTLLLFFTTYNYKQAIIYLILPKGLQHFISTGLTEIFFTYMKICTQISITFGVIISIIQIYFFLRPGLYLHESNKIKNLLTGIFFFFFLIYANIFPLLVKFLWELFLTYSQNFNPINLTFEPRLDDYLKHIQHINKMLNFSFPCVIALNLIQSSTNKRLWIKYRGAAYIVAFSLAALITPPDVFSQAFIGLPMIVFYETQTIYWALYKAYKRKLLIWQPIKTYKNSLRKEE